MAKPKNFEHIRSERDRLLKESDWMALSDSTTMTDEYKIYRQKLRDLPADATFDENGMVTNWPEDPSFSAERLDE